MPESYEIYKAPDIHEGNIAIAKEMIQSLKRLVKSTKNGHIVFSGDQLEAIDVRDKRFSLEVHGGTAARIDAQRDAFIEEFETLTGRVLWILDGNHEQKWRNICTPNKDIAKALGAQYGNGTMIKAIFPHFRMIDWHGFGSIMSKAGDPLQRKTNDKVILKRKLRHLPGGDCEVIGCAHFHRIIIVPPNRALELLTDKERGRLVQTYTEPRKIWIDKKKELYRIPEEDKWYCCTGSVLRAYVEGVSTYAEEFGLQATELGCVKIVVKNGKLEGVEEVYL